MNKSYMQQILSYMTRFASDNQNARLEPVEIKTESVDLLSTDSEPESSRVNTELVSANSNN